MYDNNSLLHNYAKMSAYSSTVLILLKFTKRIVALGLCCGHSSDIILRSVESWKHLW